MGQGHAGLVRVCVRLKCLCLKDVVLRMQGRCACVRARVCAFGGVVQRAAGWAGARGGGMGRMCVLLEAGFLVLIESSLAGSGNTHLDKEEEHVDQRKDGDALVVVRTRHRA